MHRRLRVTSYNHYSIIIETFIEEHMFVSGYVRPVNKINFRVVRNEIKSLDSW